MVRRSALKVQSVQIWGIRVSMLGIFVLLFVQISCVLALLGLLKEFERS